MRVLALDISTRTGWALFDGAQLVSYGLIEKSKPSLNDYGEYPANFYHAVTELADSISLVVFKTQPDIIVIEEVNKPGRFGSRHAQKLIDQLHFAILCAIAPERISTIRYINTTDWRKKLKLSVAETKKQAKPLLKELKRLQSELAKASKSDKKQAKANLDAHKKLLKEKCIHGKIDKKSISVAYVNARFNLSLKKGENDKSDAICQAVAYIEGVRTLTNEDIFNNKHENKTI